MRLEATPEKANLVAGGAVKRLGELELDYILDVLKAQNGNQSVTARMLGIARSTLQEKLKKYGIEERP
ncbi:MAG: helix-turn-helix domain-containing protein [Betaproteobacteria bacterium]